MATRRRTNPNRKSLVQAEGFKEFSKDLSRLTGLDIKEAETVAKALGAKTIVQRATAQAISLGKLPAKSAQDLRVGGPGVVIYGGHAYDFGAEFGAYRYKQFEIWKGNKEDAGYFLWPTVRLYRDRLMLNQWWNELRPSIKKAFRS